ncbi:MAG: phosphoglycolate phosphatase [Parvularculaceae bacterium]
MNASVNAVIFDLDGTLIDSAPDIAASLNEFLESRGAAPIPETGVRLMIGGGVRKLLERAWALQGAEAPADLDAQAAAFIDIYAQRPLRLSRPYPNAGATLNAIRARALPIGLCTNKPEAITRTILEGLGWTELFGAIIGGDTAPAKKPDPMPVQACLEMLGASAGAALLVGDSAHDLHAARAAGVRCILVKHGYSTKPVAELGADGVIDGLDAALNFLDCQASRAL